MNPNRKTAIFADILIIIGMIVGMLSVVPAVESSDYIFNACYKLGVSSEPISFAKTYP